MGSKQKIIDEILPIMLANYNGNTFVDIFCGGCSVIENVPNTYRRIANDNTYKMTQELIAIESNKSIKDNALKERLYMLGVMFYLSFKQEQSGYANGLYAFLKHCGYTLTRKNIDKLSKSDESFSAIRLLRILSDVLCGVINDTKIHQTIEYINKKYQKKLHNRINF